MLGARGGVLAGGGGSTGAAGGGDLETAAQLSSSSSGMSIISLVAICCLILPLATQQGVACEGELATLQVNHFEAERLDQVEVEQVGGWCWQVV